MRKRRKWELPACSCRRVLPACLAAVPRLQNRGVYSSPYIDNWFLSSSFDKTLMYGEIMSSLLYIDKVWRKLGINKRIENRSSMPARAEHR